MPLVSVVIAAYGRPDVLDRAIRSVLRQTHRELEVLVVCDAVGPEFLAGIDRRDARVRVLDLTVRAGAQYGPNTIGVRLARGELIAFLNHDDLWLEDHLERSLRAMTTHGSTLHLATAAFVQPAADLPQPIRVPCADGGTLVRLRTSMLNGPFDPWRTAHPVFTVFEPASAWTVDTALARRVGAWAPPRPGGPESVADWLARALRAGARLSSDAVPSVVKVELHKARATHRYAPESPEHRLLERMLEQPADVIRDEIAADLAPDAPRSAKASRHARRIREQRLASMAAYAAFRVVGDPRFLALPATSRRLLRGDLRRPRAPQGGVSRRTGEPHRPFPDPDTLRASEVPPTPRPRAVDR